MITDKFSGNSEYYQFRIRRVASSNESCVAFYDLTHEQCELRIQYMVHRCIDTC